MCVRIPGILAPEKVAVVTRVATGSPGETGVLHAIDAEHCPGGIGSGETQQGSPPHAEGSIPSHPHLILKSHNPSLQCYQHRTCPCKALKEVAQPPTMNVDISSPQPLRPPGPCPFTDPFPPPPMPLITY